MLLGHATTATDGTFTATVPAGPSRTIELAYRAFANNTNYTAQAKLTESVSAEITLRATPKHVKHTGTVTLTGQVLGDIPQGGVNVVLEVWYRRRWVTMHAPRTQGNGRFTLRYQFQNATGKFPFRVKILGPRPAFPYQSSYSNQTRVDVS